MTIYILFFYFKKPPNRWEKVKKLNQYWLAAEKLFSIVCQVFSLINFKQNNNSLKFFVKEMYKMRVFLTNEYFLLSLLTPPPSEEEEEISSVPPSPTCVGGGGHRRGRD